MNAKVLRMGDEFVPFQIFHPSSATDEYDVYSLVNRFAHSPVMQETIFPLNHKFLSPKSVQPVIDKYTALTYQNLEERVGQCNGMSIALRDFIIPLTFDASSRAFFGKHYPLNDLSEPFKLFDDKAHLLLAGVPKMFMKGTVAALDDLATIIEEKYFSKPDAMDDASEIIREFDRVTKEGGFVSGSPTHGASSCSDGLSDRTPGMLPDSPSLFSGPSKRMHHSQRTGSSRSISSDRTVSDHWSQRSTRPSLAGTPRTHPSP